MSDNLADVDPSDADVPMTNPERDVWRRIVGEQRKDIHDLARQLEDASRRAAFWQTMAESPAAQSPTPPITDQRGANDE